MNKEEAERAKNEWQNIRNNLPSGIELVGEYIHEWGTEYNGFLLFESNSTDSFLGLLLSIQSQLTTSKEGSSIQP
jgi:hypothetical protein